MPAPHPPKRPPAAPARPATYRCSEIASLLRRSTQWFYEHRVALHAKGMPAPLALPGQPRWARTQIDAWLAGWHFGNKAILAANDPAPQPAPEGALWVPFLQQAYRR